MLSAPACDYPGPLPGPNADTLELVPQTKPRYRSETGAKIYMYILPIFRPVSGKSLPGDHYQRLGLNK
jgi:hypothetical protein